MASSSASFSFLNLAIHFIRSTFVALFTWNDLEIMTQCKGWSIKSIKSLFNWIQHWWWYINCAMMIHQMILRTTRRKKNSIPYCTGSRDSYICLHCLHVVYVHTHAVIYCFNYFKQILRILLCLLIFTVQIRFIGALKYFTKIWPSSLPTTTFRVTAYHTKI